VLVGFEFGSFRISGDENKSNTDCFCILGKKRDLVQAGGPLKCLKFSLQRFVVVCNFISAVLQEAESVCVAVPAKSSLCSYSSRIEIQGVRGGGGGGVGKGEIWGVGGGGAGL